jgi:hypothetical protein
MVLIGFGKNAVNVEVPVGRTIGVAPLKIKAADGAILSKIGDLRHSADHGACHGKNAQQMIVPRGVLSAAGRR